MESIRCRNSRYKHGRTKWVRNWEKDNSNCWNIFQRKPKSWSPSSIADPEYDRPTLVACLFQSAVTFELMGQITHNAHISD